MRVRMAGMLLAVTSLAQPVAAQPAASPSGPVYRLAVHGVIENGLAPYLERGLREAAAAGASVVVLDLDTPGGRVDAAQRIVDAIRASKVPVVAFVNPRALSAGAMIALATGAIYMKPGAVLGAATPVDGQGVKASEKMVSAMRAEFRALAEQRGLDPAVAEAMVDENVAVEGLVEKGQLLTLSTGEAIRVGYARAEVAGEPELLDLLGAGGRPVVAVGTNWAEAVVRFLTHPLVSPLLLSLGMLGLVFEIKSGSFGLGGLVSLASLGLFFGSNLLIGLAGWEELILFALGSVAVGVEIFLLPGFGVAGVLGGILIAASAVMAMLGSGPTGTDIVQAITVLGASIVIAGAVGIALLRHLPHSTRFRRFLLADGMPAGEGYISAPPRPELVGREGVALTDLRPSGTAQVGEERIDVVTEGEYVASGARVRVVRSEGYRHVVQRVA